MWLRLSRLRADVKRVHNFAEPMLRVDCLSNNCDVAYHFHEHRFMNDASIFIVFKRKCGRVNG